MLEWWSRLPENIDPYLIQIGHFRVGYYGLMYIAAFFTCYLLSAYRIKSEGLAYSKEMLQDYLLWIAVGLLSGARIGYVLLYNFGYYSSHPLEIILPFEFNGGIRYTGIAGMSYHGGLIGILIATVLFMRKRKVGFWEFTDFFVPSIPAGYIFGRLGNFINGELYGRQTDVPWAMYFPSDPKGVPRHPSQLYEALLEGVLLFAVLWPLRNRKSLEGLLLAIYLIGYGTVRFFIEFFREPDAQIGFVIYDFSMGQLLCFIMIAAGASIIMLKRRKHQVRP